ncbi:hypothetical protein ASD39_17990 [Sphingomonas sp. Root50]|nr:hypothetical protein ASD17_20875 [Sphingomonas sp. Root1294]KQY72683.1 hypothetical protein ASD39_17990 [Sphingomonas sp. Root50]KRB87788.1 hypothetical protein ASE22_23585 [Sphingomonas sp. Root720]
MEIEGIRAVEPILQRLSSGELIRFRCEGDGQGRQNGWAVLYLDERPAGAFGNYRLGISRKWRIDQDLGLTAEERQALQREWAEAKQRRQEEKLRSEEEAAKDAFDLWSSSGRALSDHPYVARKQLDAIRYRVTRDGWLLVPMIDASGDLWNVQRIAGDGTKRFMRGGRTQGLFFPIGQFTQRGERTCIGEGVATMEAVHRASGYPCIASFSAKNLLPVARLWYAARPDLDYIICADDDAHLDRNIGVEAAQAAAEEIGARIATPIGRAA